MRKLSLISVIAAGALLAGCSAAPEMVSSPESTAVSPALQDEQIRGALDNIEKTLAAGDNALDANQIVSRVVGPALALRNGQYVLGRADGSQRPASMHLQDPQAISVGNTDKWPRWVLEIGSIKDNNPLHVYFFQQGSPRSNYALWGWVRAFPKAAIPETFNASMGGRQVNAVEPDLAVDPGDVANRYALMLADPTKEENSKIFDLNVDANLTLYKDTRQQLLDAFEGDSRMQLNFAPHAGNYGFMGLTTLDGGALVMADVDVDTTMKSTRSLPLSRVLTEFTGKSSAASTLVQHEKMMLLFYIPPKAAKAPVKVLGAAKAIVSVDAD